jgi:hypothetical protein
MYDFDKQRRETIGVWSDIAKRHPDLPSEINLDLHFLKASKTPDERAFVTSLKDVGFSVKFYQDDGTIEASVHMIKASAETIWLHEERATKLALIYGFKPDGWGFFIK